MRCDHTGSLHRRPGRGRASAADGSLVRAELDENTCREPLTSSETGRRFAQLMEIEGPAAAERMAAGQAKAGEKVGKGPGNFPEPKSLGRARDKAAAALGLSGRAAEKAAQVVQASDSDPEGHGDLLAKMDAESLDAAHKTPTG